MPNQDRRDELLVRRAFVHFALLTAGLIVLVVGGAIAVAELEAGHLARSGAQSRSEVIATEVQAGLVDPDQDPADPTFAAAVEETATRLGVRAVLVWDESGTVVWSTRSILVGQQFRLDQAVRNVFGQTDSLAVADGSRRDSARPRGLLGNEIEVYSPIEVESGVQLLVESHVDPATLGGDRSETLGVLLPFGIGALALFEVLALLAGAQLARRVQSSRRERIKLLTDSLSAVDHERRRLAHDLHDGIVQDLAAVRYALAGLAQEIPADLPNDPRAQLRRVCDVLEDELVALRTTLGGLLPLDRDQLALPETLTALAERLVPAEVDWSVDVVAELETVEAAQAELVSRVVQEGLRNAVRHAQPGSIAVRVLEGDENDAPQIRVEVHDDGVGTGRGLLQDEHASDHGAHYGLRLLRDLVRDLDGDLQLTDRPGGGTQLVAQWYRVPSHEDVGVSSPG